MKLITKINVFLDKLNRFRFNLLKKFTHIPHEYLSPFLIDLSTGKTIRGVICQCKLNDDLIRKIFKHYKYCYWLRHGDDDSVPCTVENYPIGVNQFGILYTNHRIYFDKTDDGNYPYVEITDFSF